jgi:excisionase family DNA binding protein
MPSVRNLRGYLLIREAASFLGVSEGTLRNWHRDGKITAYRNPANGYRLFRKADLETFLRRIARSTGPRPRAVGWGRNGAGRRSHRRVGKPRSTI